MDHNCIGEGCTFQHDITPGHLLQHVKQGISTQITYEQMHLLPSRQDFIDANLRRAFQVQVSTGKPILFLPTTVVEKNEYIDGCMKLRIYLFGVLPCGSKTCVMLDGIEVHFDVRVPTVMTSQAYDSILRGQMMAQGLNFTKVEDVKMFPLHGFRTEPCVYKRIHFNNLQDRKKCIEFITATNKALKTAGKEQLDTSADDTGRDCYYFPKVAREFRFATADWNRIEAYTQIEARSITTNCTYAFRVDVKHFKKLDKKRRADIKSASNGMSKVIDRDNTLVTQWDIETHTTMQNGQVPTPADRNFTIFMICSTYCWQWTDEAMVGVCCVDTLANARKGVPIVVVCGTERNVLQAHIEAVGRMSPEILAAFNGSNFDWPLVREKCRREGLLTKLKQNFSSLPLSTRGRYADTEDSILKWNFRSERVKIDAETNHDMDCVADFAGMLDTDVLPVFLKMYPRAEVRKSASLNFFLAKNGLESKEDMPYRRMFRIYERSLRMATIKSCHCGDAQQHCATCREKITDIDCKPKPGSSTMEAVEYSDDLHDDLMGEHGPNCCHCGKKPRSARDMADVGYYCIIDCTRPQQLYVKRTIVPDKRELSTMSYVPLRDSFFRADGSKVRNLIGSYCFRRGIAFSNARSNRTGSDKDQYPGAWVFPPNRGLHSDGTKEIEITRKDGTKIRKTIQCRPITGLDFASLYPSLMMTFNLSPDKVVYTREEAERLRALGYSLHHIKPFKYEKGEKKGAAGNRQMIGEGWTVRHNGIFNPKVDKKIIDSYTKYEKYEWVENGTPAVTKVPAQITNTSTGAVTPAPANNMADKLATLKAAGIKVKRSVSYEPTRGRDALPGEQMGIFAFIVKKLFDKRVPIKAEFVRYCHLKEQMEKDKLKTIEVKNSDGTITVLDFKADVCFNLNKIESKQKALKILMNTFYGESGNYQSSVYELLVAAGITCAGQENIKLVAEFVESKGFTVQYGDSVTHDTPILCRAANGRINYRTIDQLGENWSQYGDKEAADCAFEVWSDAGWTKINRVIRHQTNKQIYRVLTHTGCVDVTSDHSLLNEHAEKIKPTDVKIGTKLLHKDLPSVHGNVTQISAITDGMDFAMKKRQITDELLNSDKLTKAAFLTGFTTIADYAGDGKYILFPETKLDAARTFHFFSTMGLPVTMNNRGHLFIGWGVDSPDVVNTITDLGSTTEYVYDLETENHHFAAGIGRMIVHNTDSVYISPPDDVYAECDAVYKAEIEAVFERFAGVANVPEPLSDDEKAFKAARIAARRKWWEAQVDITMRLMMIVKEEVSDYLLTCNGTLYLNVAYEEVGFPTVFAGKKKYFLKAHIGTVNFDSEEVFIRGIDIIKQGQARIAKTLGEEFMSEALSPENERELIELAEDKIRKFYATPVNPANFQLTARYRPNKRNVPVQTFVARMRDIQKRFTDDPTNTALYEPPEAGDKFDFVVVKKNQRYTLQGNKIDIKKGDQMEYVRVYKASQTCLEPMALDLNYYMKNAIVGLFARFIAYHPKFQPPEGMFDVQDKLQYRNMDMYCVNAANKYLEALCDQITGFNKGEVAKVGKDYRAIWNHADKRVRRDLLTKYGGVSYVIHGLNIHSDGTDRARSTQIIDQIRTFAKESIHAGIGRRFIKVNKKRPDGLSVFALRRVYSTGENCISRIRVRWCDKREAQLIDEMYKAVPPVATISHKYEKRMINLIEDMRRARTEEATLDDEEVNEINNLNDTDRAACYHLHALILAYVAIQDVRAGTLEIAAAIEIERAQLINEPLAPVMNTRNVAAVEAKRAEILPEYEFK